MKGKYIPTFTVFTEYVAAAPYVITVRPAAVPNSDIPDLVVANEICGVAKREIHQVVKAHVPHWANTTVNARTAIIVHASNLSGGGSQTMDKFTSLRDFRPENILTILAKIAYTNISIYDIEWRFIIVPASITVGRGTATGPPSYCSPKKFAATWVDQEFGGQEIGCAAFAINYQMNHARHKYSSKPKRALKEAFKLQKQLGWGKETTISQFSDFTKLYPKWRLAVIQVAFPRSGCVYTGNEFTFDPSDSKKNVIYLMHDSINQHFGLIASPKEVYKKYLGRNDLKFCDECVEVYTTLQDHECRVNPYSKPAKTEQCTICGRYGKHSCTTTTCRQCKVEYGRGTNGSYVSHRCILYKEPCKNEFMTPTDKPGGKKYGQFVYDFESRIETVTTTKSYISEFASKDGFFTTDDYEIVPEGCHSDSPITTITRRPVFSKSLDRHVVNLVCMKNVITGDTQTFEGKNCVEQFLTYLLEYNRGRNIAIAHNGSGYDTCLVFETATQLGLKNLKMVPILQGSKFMQLTIGKLIFRDSMLHLKGSLASLSKDFCPPNTLLKGYFPHLFNTYYNWEYEGIIPGKEFFDLAFVMKDENELARFNQWHDEQVKQGGLWNFQTEIKKYCRNDVEILADVIKGYSTNAEKLVGASPLFKATSPSFVHDTILIDYSKKLNLELPKGQKDFDTALHQSKVEKIATETGWAVLVPNEYHYARLALRGGRTDVRKLYHNVTEEEHLEGRDIIYQDICSQYPFQQVVHQFPTGTPLIHVWDIKYYPCVRCQNSEQMRDRGTCKCTDKLGDRDCRIVDLMGTQEWTTQQLLERKSFFGIITVTLEAPKNLYHPVLVGYDRTRGKSIASLEDESLKEYTTTTVELLKAIDKGYKLIRIHRYDEYTRSNSLWTDMILKFFVQKLINSQDILSEEEYKKFYHSAADLTPAERAKKKEALTPVQAKELVDKYEDMYGIGELIQKEIDQGTFGNNPAMKATAKTILNAAWGKQAQRPILTEACILNHVTEQREIDELFQNVVGGVFSFQDATILNDTDVMYRFKADNARVDLKNNYLPVAVFVTAYARLQLGDQLDLLGDRVLMNDTDSIVYIHDPDGYNIPEGSMLGEWEIEKPCKLNGGIKTFVGFGPKTYAFKAWRQDYKVHTVVKAKGLSLKYAHSNLVNFEVMEEMMKEFLKDPDNYNQRIKVPQKSFSFSFNSQSQQSDNYIEGGMRTRKTVKDLRINLSTMKGILDGPLLFPFGHEHNSLPVTPKLKKRKC